MKYIVIGRVHPERADVVIRQAVVFRPEGGGIITVTCEASQLAVIVDSVPIVDGYIAAVIGAEYFARTAIAPLGFSLGTGYTVEVIQVIEETGEVHVIGTRPGNLAFETDIGAAALALSKRNVHFRLALHDYMKALSSVLDCAFFCFRAIEALKSSFAPGTDGWSQMHAALGTSRDAIERTIKVFADAVRHGNWPHIKVSTSAERNAMLLLTRDILHNYMVWAGRA